MYKKKRIIVYGAGVGGKQLLSVPYIKENIVFFCDICRTGSLNQIPIISIDELQEIHQDYDVVISLKKPDSIIDACKELSSRGIPFHSYSEICRTDWFQKDLEEYNNLNHNNTKFKYYDDDQYPILTDKYSFAGEMGRYFWQDLWGARKIELRNPERHYDIGSRIDGFILSLLSQNRKISLIDIRPIEGELPDNLSVTLANATDLEGISDETIDSISALCSIEHFGLGRYGDPIDPDAWFKCICAIQKKTMIGGHIYISVPVGQERLEFNAHRIFAPKTIIESFNSCHLVEFSITDGTGIKKDADLEEYGKGGERGTVYGLFEFSKK